MGSKRSTASWEQAQLPGQHIPEPGKVQATSRVVHRLVLMNLWSRTVFLQTLGGATPIQQDGLAKESKLRLQRLLKTRCEIHNRWWQLCASPHWAWGRAGSGTSAQPGRAVLAARHPGHSDLCLQGSLLSLQHAGTVQAAQTHRFTSIQIPGRLETLQ